MKILNLVKSLNVNYINAFKILLDEWIKNKTLNDDCIMILWAWLTKIVNISQEDRIVVTFLLSLLARYTKIYFNFYNRYIKYNYLNEHN
jgi:hypothetical protein